MCLATAQRTDIVVDKDVRWKGFKRRAVTQRSKQQLINNSGRAMQKRGESPRQMAHPRVQTTIWPTSRHVPTEPPPSSSLSARHVTFLSRGVLNITLRDRVYYEFLNIPFVSGPIRSSLVVCYRIKGFP